jgi:CRISPR-associated protein Cas1
MNDVTSEMPLIPVRMLNEFVYCPRLGYLEWVQGEFLHSADTVDGAIKHQRVDKGGGVLPEKPQELDSIHARSVDLGSERMGITAKIDVVDGDGAFVTPIDYKRGKRPHVAGGVYAPEKVQICAQALLLMEHGFSCDHGVIYFAASRERVPVSVDQELMDSTFKAIADFKNLVAVGQIPEPLENSPKCLKCSLAPICLPDEIRFLKQQQTEIRPIYASCESALPLYIQKAGAYVRKDGAQLIVEMDKEKIAEARLVDISQIVLFGHSTITTPVLHECLRRNIPVTYLSYGGWFMGHTVGTGHKNVETRTAQYRASFDSQICLKIARGLISAKISNCRTLIRRNWKGLQSDGGKAPEGLLNDMRGDIDSAVKANSLDSLLGIEGAAAARYFRNFRSMFSEDPESKYRFDFDGRNRRPPKDPVNAMLSFAYAMLTREWTITLSAVGLDPYRGFYHQLRFGRPALALDMMESFRPLIADSTVITAVNNGEVRPSDFITAAGSCNLTDSGRKRFIGVFERRMSQEITHPIFQYRISYRQILEVQARLLIRHLLGEVPEFPNFVTR